MSNIKTQDMIVVATTFQGAYEHVLSNLSENARDLAKRFTAEIVLREKPYMLVSAEGLIHAQGLVFGRDENRDFILTLTYTFFARLGEDTQFVNGLIESIARGAAVSIRSDLNAVPKDIADRLPEFKDVQELLEANYWLVTMLMLSLFITVTDIEQQISKVVKPR